MARLRYSTESKEDLKRIVRYIAQDKPDAARAWAGKIRETCRLIAKQPSIGDSRPELGNGIRNSYLGSYVIYFQSSDEAVEIVRIIRSDRDTRLL